MVRGRHHDLHARFALGAKELHRGAHGEDREEVLEGLPDVAHCELRAEAGDGRLVEAQDDDQVLTCSFRSRCF